MSQVETSIGAAPPAEHASGFFGTIWRDFASFAELKGSRLDNPLALIDVLMYPGVIAVLIFRVAHLFHRAHLRPLSRLLYFWNVVLFGADLAPAATVGPGFCLPHPVGTGLGNATVIGRNFRMLRGVGIGGAAYEDQQRDGMPVIGDDVWALHDVLIFGPITVGDRAILGARSLVMKSVPPDAVVAGTPAKVLRYRGRGAGNPVANEGETDGT